MSITLRAGVLSVLALLVCGALGSVAQAGSNLFDDNYRNCPSYTRLPALADMKVVRTDEDDELQVVWATPNPATWNLASFTAYITIIVQGDTDGDGDIEAQKKAMALGASSVVFDNLAIAQEYDVQVAVTDRGYVISDIAEAVFTSGIKKPMFWTPIYYHPNRVLVLDDTPNETLEDNIANQIGRFYFLGFNARFDNWWSKAEYDIPRFRVGLRHGLTAAVADKAQFDHFRIRVEDAGGHNVLGFDAATVYDKQYANTLIEYDFDASGFGNLADVFGPNGTSPAGQGKVYISNIAKSNRLEPRLPALHNNSGFVERQKVWFSSSDGCFSDQLTHVGELSFAVLPADGQMDVMDVHAAGPDHISDLPSDLLDRDGTYTITAWAEDEDNNPISPQAAITFSVQEVFNGYAFACRGGGLINGVDIAPMSVALNLTLQAED